MVGEYSSSLSGQELVLKLKEGLPPEAFRPRRVRGMIIFPLLGIILTGTWAVIRAPLPWYAKLLISFFISMAYGSMAFLAHETLHGSTFRSRWAQDFVGTCGFFIFCITPTLWRVWHNQVHHVLTNIPDVDPDSYGTLERYKKIPLARLQFKTGVGSGHWLSAFFYLYRFSYHSQIVLWVLSKKYKKEFRKLNRRRAIAESLCIMAFWIAFAALIGFPAVLYAILIPMMTANFILMSYISTNHFLRPLTDEDESVDHSMSLSVSRFIDLIHLQFSHHVEHHYFPNMSPHYAPLVRKNLMRYAGDRYLAPPYWTALRWLYKTPRVYEDAETLIHPFTGKRIKIKDVEKELKNSSDKHHTSPHAHPHGLAAAS
jgi:fatty acid desaturase